MMAKKTAVDSVEAEDKEVEEMIAEAQSTSGRTPQDVRVIMRETARMLEAVKLSKAGEAYIGTYFVPLEGQPGIEGLVNAGANLITQTIQQGWQPWGMGTPYFGKYAFNLGGRQTGMLDGQWLTIVYLRPAEELE
jgi:hypothetical protein